MKLNFKDLKQQKFSIEIEPTATIAQVKEKISEEKGLDAGSQKLIYSGKILQDANTVESYKIEEKGYIVCMNLKPKTAPAASSSTVAAPSTPAASTAQTPAAPAAPVQAASNPSDAPATPSPAPAAGATREFNDPSAFALNTEARQSAIANMESMGFPRTEIDRAMRAAYFNPDRAVEYLLNGIPENVAQEQRQQTGGGLGAHGATAAAATPAAQDAASPTAQAATAAQTGGDDADQPINLFDAATQAARAGGAARSRGAGGATGAGVGGDGGAEGGANLGNLEFLRDNPQFQQLRQIVQTQPRMLEPILQQVGQGNPQLAQMIGDNPEQFLRLLSEDVGDDIPLPPGAQQEISVTEEERDAIERLCRLGFERDMVIQAYFACDKNEELAANFLFDQPDDGDEGGATT